MKALSAPDDLIRAWLQNPHAFTVGAFAIAGVFLGFAGWQIQRNLRHNEPSLCAPPTLPFTLIAAGAGVFGTSCLPSPVSWITGSVLCALAGLLFHFADHRRF